MTITSQRVIENYKDGLKPRKLSLGYTDHNDKEHVFRRNVPDDTDADLYLMDNIENAQAKLEMIELRGVAQRVQNGEDSLILAMNPVHTTTNDIIKNLVYFMLSEKDIRFVTKLIPLIETVRLTTTNAELAVILESTEAEVVVLFSQYETVKDLSTQMEANNFVGGWS